MLPRWLYVTLLLILLLFLLQAFWRGALKARDRRMATLVTTPAGFQQAMSELAEKAVQDAKNEFNLTLDYSPQSVEQVEHLLGEVHKRHQKTPLSNKEITRYAMRFGIYVGEVIRRQKSGHWIPFEPKAYEPMQFQMIHRNHEGKEATNYPVNWCGKRILNGDEDNVWHKFLLFVEEDTKTRKLGILIHHSQTAPKP